MDGAAGGSSSTRHNHARVGMRSLLLWLLGLWCGLVAAALRWGRGDAAVAAAGCGGRIRRKGRDDQVARVGAITLGGPQSAPI